MAQKSGGGWIWLLAGVLGGVALTLAALLFLNSGSGSGADTRTVADDAASAAASADRAALPAPAAPAQKADTVPTPADAGLDPATDDQMADDAAASGMTSRAPAPNGE